MKPVGVSIGVAFLGMVLFGVYHWFFVAPVVAVFIEGILWAVGAGAAIGWAYQRAMLDHARIGPWWGLAFGGLFASTLIPSQIVGLVWGPFPEVASPGDVLPLLPLAFLGVPMAVVIAWLLAERRGVCWPFVVAVAVTHFMIGGSIANFGGRGATALMFFAFALLELLGGLLLGVLFRGSRSPTQSAPSSEPGLGAS